MHPTSKFIVTVFGCVFYWLLSGAALAAAPEDPSDLLKNADRIKTSSQREFLDTLKKLDERAGSLTVPQQLYLRYLKAWQLA